MLYTESDVEAYIGDIEHIITSLHRYSASTEDPIAQSAPGTTESTFDVSLFAKLDMQYVRNKFPTAPIYLLDRLAQANTTRRQFYVQMAEDHHQPTPSWGSQISFKIHQSSTEYSPLQLKIPPPPVGPDTKAEIPFDCFYCYEQTNSNEWMYVQYSQN